MYLDHRVTAKIARMLERVDMSALLLDANGLVLLPEGDKRHFTLPEAIKRDPSTPLVYGGVTLIGTDDEQPLFICLHGDSAEVRNCAILCAELINMLLRVDMGQASREQALRLMLRGEVEGAELESLALEHGIESEKSRCVLYLYFTDDEAEAIMPRLTADFANEEDMFTEVSRHSVAMIKTVGEPADFDALLSLAERICDAFGRDNRGCVYVGISDPRKDLALLPEAYDEARGAINVGSVYHGARQIFVHRHLLLEHFLSDVPLDMSANYSASIFNRRTAKLFNEEMIHTIEIFFENSLNLSETARKLYIHRNTLVYRLEKVQRAIGLDLRSFDDAVTFKLMMLLSKNGTPKKQRL